MPEQFWVCSCHNLQIKRVQSSLNEHVSLTHEHYINDNIRREDRRMGKEKMRGFPLSFTSLISRLLLFKGNPMECEIHEAN